MSHDLQFDQSINGVIQEPVDGGSSFSMPSNLGDSHQQQGGWAGGGGFQGQSSHPTVCVFHCLFKTLALLLYLIAGWFAGSGANFITVTVICILLLAADFWVVKNITGRLLVGLRWWNKVEGETTRWIFESAERTPDGKEIERSNFDKNVFWTIIYLTPVIWSFLFLFAVLRFNFKWLIVVFMALGLSGANTYGYMKCSSDQKVRFQRMMESGAQQGALTIISSSVVGVMSNLTRNLGGGTAPPPPANTAATYA